MGGFSIAYGTGGKVIYNIGRIKERDNSQFRGSSIGINSARGNVSVIGNKTDFTGDFADTNEGRQNVSYGNNISQNDDLGNPPIQPVTEMSHNKAESG